MWEVVIVVIVLVLFAGLIGLLVEGMGPTQYTPMGPDEEEAWLRGLGLDEETIREIMDIPWPRDR